MYFDPIYVEIMVNKNLEFRTFSKFFCPLTEYNFIISVKITFSYLSNINFKSYNTLIKEKVNKIMFKSFEKSFINQQFQ